MPFGPGFALNFIQRIFFLSSRFTWKACVINFILLGNSPVQCRSQRIQKKVFAKSFCTRIFSYSILYYILHFSVHKFFFYFYNLRISLRELYYCNRCALDKICEIYTFDRCPHGCTGQKSFLACGDAKKENWRTTKREVERTALSESGS